MFARNLVLATFTVFTFFCLYKICAVLGLPLYPYGMLFFLIPIFGLIPLYQYLEFKQLRGYKQHLLETGNYTAEHLDSMTGSEIESCWRDSLRG